jgi:hypothetical protein
MRTLNTPPSKLEVIMSVANRFGVSALLLALVALSGCGGSGGGSPSGPFSNSSLNGMYAFSFSGANQFGFLAVAGSFAANGSGTITGGTIDVNSGGSPPANTAVTGTYRVSPNGQGTASLKGTTTTFNLDFVLLSNASNVSALVIRFDTNSSGSGTIVLQNSAAFSLNALAGTLVFNLSGADASGLGNPMASAGAFTVDNAGNLTGGIQDTNDAGIISPNVPLAPANLAMTAPSNGRGTLALGARNFAYYIVDATHLKLVETDVAPALAGEAYSQSSAPISNSFAFTTSGASTSGTFVSGGILNTDGAGNVLNTSMEDVNNAGVVVQNVGLTGPYVVLPNGRGTMTLNGATINFAIYPTVVGVQMIEIDSAAVATGTAFQQSGQLSTASVEGNYGWNFSGVVNGLNQIDSIAQFAANAGAANGLADFNNGGFLSPGLALTGSYAAVGSGRGSATFQSNLGTQAILFYIVDSSQVLFIDADTDLVAAGQMVHQ